MSCFPAWSLHRSKPAGHLLLRTGLQTGFPLRRSDTPPFRSDLEQLIQLHLVAHNNALTLWRDLLHYTCYQLQKLLVASKNPKVANCQNCWDYQRFCQKLLESRRLPKMAGEIGLGLAAAVGIGLGLRHGIDWDHIAAITDVTSAQPSRARGFAMGTLYAMGHAAVVILLGLLAIWAAAQLPEWLDAWMETIVGITLITLGLWIFWTLIRNPSGVLLRSRWMLLATAIRSAWRWALRKFTGKKPPAGSAGPQSLRCGGLNYYWHDPRRWSRDRVSGIASRLCRRGNIRHCWDFPAISLCYGPDYLQLFNNHSFYGGISHRPVSEKGISRPGGDCWLLQPGCRHLIPDPKGKYPSGLFCLSNSGEHSSAVTAQGAINGSFALETGLLR